MIAKSDNNYELNASTASGPNIKYRPDSDEKSQRWKGVVFMILYGLVLSLTFLVASLIYSRNPTI